MNNEYVAVRHLLTAPRIAARTAPFIGEESFDFDALAREAEAMSGGEQLLVRIADELWSAERHAGLSELVRRLDIENFERVLQALRLARGAYLLSSVTAFLAERRQAA
jgi:ABC-type uncharacterized transport system ATPase subunit